MSRYEYKVVPAPQKGTKAKGVRTPEGRFANSVELLLNKMAGSGWEYLRAELLPSAERSGLTGSETNWRNVLVFRRPVEDAVDETQDETPQIEPILIAPTRDADGAAPSSGEESADNPADELENDDTDKAQRIPGPGAVRMLKDDGVEEVSPVAGMTEALRTRAAQQDEVDDTETKGETRDTRS